MKKPKCQCEGCNKNAVRLYERKSDGVTSYRKSSWVREKFNVKEGFVCGSCHQQHNAEVNGYPDARTMTADRQNLTTAEYIKKINLRAANKAGYFGEKAIVNYLNSKHLSRRYRKSYCENVDGRLGFICTTHIEDSCMLQVDHWDGDPRNNKKTNCITLCACCHAYKTKIYGDGQTKGRKTYKKEGFIVAS